MRTDKRSMEPVPLDQMVGESLSVFGSTRSLVCGLSVGKGEDGDD